MSGVTTPSQAGRRYHPFIVYCGDRVFVRSSHDGTFVEIEAPHTDFYRIAMAHPDELDSATLADLQRLRIEPAESGIDADVDDTLLETIRATTAFVDYASPETFHADRENMIAVAQSDGMPRLASSRYHAFGVLSEQPGSRRASLLMELIRTVFVVRGVVRFHNHQVFHKAIPSMGARHGIEAYLSIAENDGTQTAPPGCYHFSPTEDRFRGPLEALVPSVGTGILLSAVFERYQWRYRSSWVYQCILLDIGHAVGALKALASAEGRQLQVHEVRDINLNIGDALEEDIFLSMTLAE